MIVIVVDPVPVVAQAVGKMKTTLVKITMAVIAVVAADRAGTIADQIISEINPSMTM